MRRPGGAGWLLGMGLSLVAGTMDPAVGGQASPPEGDLGQCETLIGYRAKSCYFLAVDFKIDSTWAARNPAGPPGSVVTVRFHLLRTGEVRDLAVESSSGDAAFDAAAVQAIQESAPFPPFPRSVPEASLPVSYTLRARARP